MSNYRRSISLYPLFQIPFIFLCLFLVTAALFWFLGVGRPNVAVTIALDLSSSTYNNAEFNAPNTIMSREVQAVKAYLDKNNSGILRQPNLVKIIGFASIHVPLTQSFQADSEQIKMELDKALQNPKLPSNLGGSTNINLAIQEGTRTLSEIGDRCRELLLVTDGEASVSGEVITQAKNNLVKINAIVIGAEAEEIQLAVDSTRGRYISVPNDTNLDVLFVNQFFYSFNNNWRWVILWLGLAWIALMWTIAMPLDRWFFQGLLGMPFNLAGRLAISNAWFWTAATPGILVSLYRIFNWASPFVSSC